MTEILLAAFGLFALLASIVMAFLLPCVFCLWLLHVLGINQ